jgi:hypothetical protein
MTDLGKVVLGVLSRAKEILKSKRPIKVADILTDYIQIFNPNDFILKKKYKIVKVRINSCEKRNIVYFSNLWKMALNLW